MTHQDPLLPEPAPHASIEVSSLDGQVDSVTPHVIRGWAFDPSRPETPVELVATDRGEELGVVVADAFRDDLAQAGVGSGRHGFELWLPRRLSPLERHVVRVFRRSDGRELFYSPVVLEPSDAFGLTMQTRLDELLRAPMSVGELDERIGYFLGLVETLKQRRAEARRGLEPRGRGALRAAPRALVIDTILPDPARDAGSNAILSHVRSLRRLGYDVTFLPSRLDVAARETIDALAGEGIALALKPVFASVEELLQRECDAYDLVYLHRLENAARYAPLVRMHQAGAHIVYSVADLHHQRLARQAGVEGRLTLQQLAEITRLRELQAAWGADAIITHSRAEAKLLQTELPHARVHVVPWDVSIDLIVRPFERRAHLGFFGGFDHTPNVEAAQRLATRIMPLVWRTHPDIKATIFGSHIPVDVQRLAQRGIDVIGHAPDLFLVLNRLRLTVAPLSYGAGIKGKVLESLARGLPCVMSPIAAEGLDLPSDFEALIGDGDEALARAIVAVHEDSELNARLAARGVDYVHERWHETSVDGALREACTPALED